MKNILAKIFGGAGGSVAEKISGIIDKHTFSKEEKACLLYTSPSPRDVEESRMPSSA